MSSHQGTRSCSSPGKQQGGERLEAVRGPKGQVAASQGRGSGPRLLLVTAPHGAVLVCSSRAGQSSTVQTEVRSQQHPQTLRRTRQPSSLTQSLAPPWPQPCSLQLPSPLGRPVLPSRPDSIRPHCPAPFLAPIPEQSQALSTFSIKFFSVPFQ